MNLCSEMFTTDMIDLGECMFETERTVESVGLSKHLGEALQALLEGCG